MAGCTRQGSFAGATIAGVGAAGSVALATSSCGGDPYEASACGATKGLWIASASVLVLTALVLVVSAPSADEQAAADARAAKHPLPRRAGMGL